MASPLSDLPGRSGLSPALHSLKVKFVIALVPLVCVVIGVSTWLNLSLHSVKRRILNRPECFQCHGSQAAVNGILHMDMSLGELAASLAHEIKNPLAGIAGAIHQILDRVLVLLAEDPESRQLRVVRS
jgi:signal transduction histidine kinase